MSNESQNKKPYSFRLDNDISKKLDSVENKTEVVEKALLAFFDKNQTQTETQQTPEAQPKAETFTLPQCETDLIAWAKGVVAALEKQKIILQQQVLIATSQMEAFCAQQDVLLDFLEADEGEEYVSVWQYAYETNAPLDQQNVATIVNAAKNLCHQKNIEIKFCQHPILGKICSLPVSIWETVFKAHDLI